MTAPGLTDPGVTLTMDNQAVVQWAPQPPHRECSNMDLRQQVTEHLDIRSVPFSWIPSHRDLSDATSPDDRAAILRNDEVDKWAYVRVEGGQGEVKGACDGPTLGLGGMYPPNRPTHLVLSVTAVRGELPSPPRSADTLTPPESVPAWFSPLRPRKVQPNPTPVATGAFLTHAAYPNPRTRHVHPRPPP